MSWIEEYKRVKEETPNKIILFDGGAFYNAIEDDAEFLNKKLGLQTSNDKVCGYKKCGFPIKSLKKYAEIFETNNIDFIIIKQLPKKESKENIKQRILREISKLDLDNMTPLEAYQKLLEFQNKLNK